MICKTKMATHNERSAGDDVDDEEDNDDDDDDDDEDATMKNATTRMNTKTTIPKTSATVLKVFAS